MTTQAVGGSAIVAVKPLLNVLLEIVVERPAGADGPRVAISPGVRLGWNLGDTQLVAGAAIPVERGVSSDVSVLGYLSWELPFRRR